MAEAEAVTRDAFYGGRLIIDQHAKGHRSGTDAVLLAAAVSRDCAGLVYDVGSGSGAAGLGIALTCPVTRVRLIEVNEAVAALAKSNIATNAMADRVALVTCDVLSRDNREASLPHLADVVVSNPPFYEPARVRASPDSGRRAAHVLPDDATLADWIASCFDLLTGKGVLILVHRASALPAILAAVARQAGGIRVLAVHPRRGEPAVRVLVRAVKGSRAPFAIAPPLCLHLGDGFTDDARSLHLGEKALSW